MRVKLGDIFEIGSGGTPSKSHPEYYGGDIPWVKTGDLKNEYLYEVEDFITEEGLKNSSAKVYEADTVLIAMYGATIGATSILKINACTNQACAAFKKNEQVIPEYLYYFLRSQKKKFVKDGVGGAQPNISAGYLKKVEMELPSLEEQRAIVDILDKTSDIVIKRNQEIQSLDDLIKARFVEMFGNPIYNSNDLPIKSLNDLGEWSSGGTPSRTIPKYFEGDINWYSAGELNTLFLDGSVEKITEEAIEKSAAKLFEAGSMLVGMYDTAAFKMGILKEDSASNQACACITPNDEVNIIWLYYELQLMKEHFLSQRRGVRQKNLNLGMIKGFEVPIANREQQDMFVDFVKQVDKSKFAVQKALNQAQLLFDSLMQQYFG